MVKTLEGIRGTYQQQLRIGLVSKEAPAGLQRDPGTMVPSHAVNSQSSHALKCRAFWPAILVTRRLAQPAAATKERPALRAQPGLACRPRGQASFLVFSTFRPR